ncbi:R-SNARE family protein [Legionella clemsonensis]|uniref:Synaptobrevin n=1 Tax=Legionella clemsonensis TaxID=1867846 RepID=A0A222P5G4_9GAMM|nr:R-SNARE family protein [Legionella clemsonensis]ASQ47094.1 Synaptobrevin [Legionella clemsonensis]
MKCYALGTRFGDTSFDWLISVNSSFFGSGFFERQIKQSIEKHKDEIASYCSMMNPNETFGTKKEGFYLYITRLVHDYCVIVVDSELSEQQMRWLCFYLLKKKIEKNTVAANIEEFTQDYKITQIKSELHETTEIMKQNIEKLHLREEGLKKLVEKTEELETLTFHFNKKAKALNSCWPSCVLI